MQTAKKRVVGKPFKKGQSGNPNGRPAVVKEVRELARQHTDDAIKTLVEICKDPDKSDAARVSAATQLLDRGYGRAPQTMKVEGLDGLLGGLGIAELGLVEQVLLAASAGRDDPAEGSEEAPALH